MGHIQEIVDIKLMFELICMFFYLLILFLSSLQMVRKEENQQ